MLHRSSPLLAHEAVRYGRLLFARDEEVRVDFVVRTHREYIDTKPLREIQRS